MEKKFFISNKSRFKSLSRFFNLRLKKEGKNTKEKMCILKMYVILKKQHASFLIIYCRAEIL